MNVVATGKIKGTEIEFDVVSTGGGLILDWQARNEAEKGILIDMIGFERALSAALDSDDGVGERNGVIVSVVYL